MKKILIAGCNGLLGQQLVKDLEKNKEYQVIGISQSAKRYHSDLYQFIQADITDNFQLASLFSRFEPEYVIHTAAISSPDACEENKVLAWQVNVEASENIAQLCRKHQSYLCHLSTDFVFDGISGPYCENDEPNPVSYYGLTKWESEKRVSDLMPDASILRTVLVYGMHENMTRGNILTRIISLKKNPVPISMVSDQMRTPTFLPDLSKACVLACEKKSDGLFHISGNETISVYNFSLLIAEIFDVNKNLISPIMSSNLNEKAMRPKITGFNIEKAMQQLNYYPKGLIEGLRLIKNNVK